ncbi:PREDICTED: pathogenesis-related protein 5-like isoform X1 [Camelina sativa]|uniref:Pathogenesis-related protein 5-like isoform X1 n=2 Tax=Camelina sativa TaxID=90675 RepID=A0ABM0T5T0_CAMSA|nr:PREDICTED: pathogenesis-related protein 5-like isoform X1 [Camelina sativa]
MGKSPMVPMAVLFYVSVLFSVSYASTFVITNNCPFTIWPGTLAGSGTQALPTTGFRLDVGQSVRIPSTLGWSGRIWARTGCNFDANGMGKCMTGDCGGKLECAGNGAAPPTSLFEITLGHGSDDKDFYDISLVDGYNLPIVALPTGGGLVGACNATGCVADVNNSCPKELQVMGEEEEQRGGVVACKSACEAFGLDQYCCSGQFANPTACRPSMYSSIFKRACPRAYSYAFDDGTSTFTCKASEYAIIFCPGRVKRPDSQSSDPPSPPQNQFGQPMAPPPQNSYGQPMAPPTYGQPMAPPTQNQYNQPVVAPPTQNQYSPPVAPLTQNPPGPNEEIMAPPPQNQNGNGQLMPPPTVNQVPNDQYMNPPIEDQSQRETQSSSDILRPFPVLLLLGFSLTALRQSGMT